MGSLTRKFTASTVAYSGRGRAVGEVVEFFRFPLCRNIPLVTWATPLVLFGVDLWACPHKRLSLKTELPNKTRALDPTSIPQGDFFTVRTSEEVIKSFH